MRAYHAELCRDPDARRDDDEDDAGIAEAEDASTRPVKITSLAQLREIEDAARARALAATSSG